MRSTEPLADIKTVQETESSKVMDAMSTCFSSGSERDAAFAKMIPALATAVSVAVVEVMWVVMGKMDERLEIC